MTSHYKKTRADLMDELSDQLSFLASSALSYDHGNVSEAKRLATTIYTLIYDGTGRTISLCKHLGFLPKMRMLSVCPVINTAGGKFTPYASPLTTLVLSPDHPPRAEPVYTGPDFPPPPYNPRWISIAKWLSEQVSSPGAPILTRRNLIYAVRNQDGGSHCDDKLRDSDYVTMRANALSPELALFYRGAPARLTGATAATIRQMSWEVEKSIIEALMGQEPGLEDVPDDSQRG